jgi:N utilization substance protein B
MSERNAPRRQSRRAALQVLYAVDVGPGARGGEKASAADVFENVAAHFDLHGGAHAFAKELALGVEAHRDEVDAHIASCARNWRLERMAAVDRNVLRLAAYELLHTDTPHSIVIDEAVELAREFGSEPSPAFVNGVLDAVARAGRGGAGEGPAA